jgi:hypothetical protein
MADVEASEVVDVPSAFSAVTDASPPAGEGKPVTPPRASPAGSQLSSKLSGLKKRISQQQPTAALDSSIKAVVGGDAARGGQTVCDDGV